MADLSDTLAALSECPFCGSGAKIVAPLGFGNVRAAECGNSDCAATGPWAANEAEAIAAWNTRTGQLVPVPSVEAWQLRCGELASALDRIIGCFNAAFAEGLQEQLNAFEAEPGNLVDLIQRRILFANYYAIEALREHTAVIAAMQEGRDG